MATDDGLLLVLLVLVVLCEMGILAVVDDDGVEQDMISD